MATWQSNGTPGTTSAGLPAGAASGDMIVVFAYRSASTTAPTLPANWTNANISFSGTAVNSTLVAYRIYDGVWTMPTFTNASRCDSICVRPASGKGVKFGVVEGDHKSQANIVWDTATMQVTDGTSIILRGVVHSRTDGTSGSAIPLPTPGTHVLVSQTGTQPTFGTWRKTVTLTDMNTASSTISRSTTYTVSQVEVRDFSTFEATAASTFTFTGTASATGGPPQDIDAAISTTFSFTATSVAGPPSLIVGYYESPFNQTGFNSAFDNVTWQTGDLVVIVLATSESSGASTETTTPSASGLTFTDLGGFHVTTRPGINGWVATATNSITSNITYSFNGTGQYGGACWVLRGHDGLGTVAIEAVGTTLVTKTLTSVTAGSEVLMTKFDTNAVNTTYSPSPSTNFTERKDTVFANWTVWVGDWLNQPAGTNVAYGATSSTGTNDAMAVIEVKKSVPAFSTIQATISDTYSFTATAAATNTPFTPTDLSGLQAWYDASDAASITAITGRVSQWNDKSGNARNLTQATATARPVTGTRTQNGLNVIDYDIPANGQRLPSATFTMAQPFTYAVVCQSDKPDTAQHVVAGATGSTCQLGVQGGQYRMFAGTQLLGGTDDTSAHYIVAAFNGASSTLHVDGVLVASGNAGTTGFVAAGFTVGINSANTWDGTGDEFVVVNRLLTTAEQKQLESYFGAKWAIAAAPVSATVSGPFTFTTTAASTVQHEATVSGPFSFAATAVATPQHEAVIATSFSFTTTATSTVQREATVATSFAFTAISTAVKTVEATAAQQHTFTATATASTQGANVVQATIATTWAFAASTTAITTHSAAISDTFSFSAAAAAVPQHVATAVGGFSFAAAATSTVQHEATASGPFTFTATAAATPTGPGQAVISTTFGFTATSTAITTHVATVAGTFTFTATAAAGSQKEATVATTYAFTATSTATNKTPISASIATTFTFTTSSTAVKSAEAIINQVYLFTATSAAVKTVVSTASGQFTFTATASSGKTVPALAAGNYTFTATAGASVVPTIFASIATLLVFQALASATATAANITILNTADNLALGDEAVDAIYVGPDLVWSRA